MPLQGALQAPIFDSAMAQTKPNFRTKAEETVEELRTRYPNLTIDLETVSSQSDREWTLPVQPGLKHKILLYVSHDELSFDAGHFHMSYFPCDEEEPRARFLDAVTGFIDGRYRVQEHYRRKACIAADLQELKQGEWRSVAAWSRLHWPFPRKKRYRILRNGD